MDAGDRRLAAIVFVDVVGYSRVAEHDEPGALGLVERLGRMFAGAAAGHGGRVVKSLGDGFLAEFGSALGAVEGAIELQRSVEAANRELGGTPFAVRTGIHVGDVVERDGDVLGDAVNVAARIQTLAEGGGTCVSQAVHDQVVNRVVATWQPLDRPRLKNLEFPWEVFRLEPCEPAERLAGFARPPLPLIDRTEERARLLEALRGVAAGRGGTVLVAGEAGIGKTRLAREAALEARRLGVTFVVGRALDQDVGNPLGPWAEALHELTTSMPAAELLPTVGLGAITLGRLVPDLLSRVGATSVTPPPGEPDRFALFEAVRQVLSNAARRHPLVVCLEDLHWADGATLQLLEFIARTGVPEPLLLLGSYRPEEAGSGSRFAATRYELDRTERLLEIRIPPLPDEAVRRLIGEAVGAQRVDAPVFEVIQERSAGNPLFADELARSLRDEGRLTVRDGAAVWLGGAVRLPPTIEHLIERRVERLSAPTRERLKRASVLGPRFDLPTLEAVTGEGRDTLLGSLEEGLAAGVLEEAGAEPGRFRFADRRVEAHLRQSVSLPRRQEVHRKAAEHLAALGKAPPEELAVHFEGAGLEEFAAGYFEQAGDEAVQFSCLECAVGRFDRALRDLPRPARDARRRVGVKKGRALEVQGRFAEARAALEEARKYVAQPEDDLPIAIWLSAVALREGDRATSRREIERALELAGGQTTVDAADAYSGLAVLLSQEGRGPEAIDAAQRSLAIARSLRRNDLIVQGLNNLYHADVVDARWAEAAAAVNERRELSDDDARPFEVAINLYDAATLHSAVDPQLERAVDEFTQAESRFERMGSRTWSLACREGRAWALVDLGRWTEALREAETGARSAHERELAAYEAAFLLLRSEVARRQRDLELGGRVLARAAEVLPAGGEGLHHLRAAFHVLSALQHLDRGDRDRARAELGPWWDPPDRHRCGDCAGPLAVAVARVEAFAEDGDPVRFGEAIDYLGQRGEPASRHRGAAPLARWRRLRRTASEEGLGAAEEFFRAAGLPYDLAEALEEHGATLEALGKTGDGTRTVTRARELFESLRAGGGGNLGGAPEAGDVRESQGRARTIPTPRAGSS